MTKPSLKEECRLKVMDEKCLSGPFRISLGGLYARKTRDRMTTALAKQAGRPEERDPDKKNNQHRILCALLPAEYRLMPDGTDLANLKEASISRFFICAENPNTGKLYSERQYEAVGNNLIDLARKAGFRTGEFTLLPHIRGQLQIMLAELTENERRDFSADAMTLLERLKNKSKKSPDLASHAEGLKKLGTLEEQLAYLTVIALTWSCWSWNNDALTKDLAFLLLTPKKEGTEIQAVERKAAGRRQRPLCQAAGAVQRRVQTEGFLHLRQSSRRHSCAAVRAGPCPGRSILHAVCLLRRTRVQKILPAAQPEGTDAPCLQIRLCRSAGGPAEQIRVRCSAASSASACQSTARNSKSGLQLHQPVHKNRLAVCTGYTAERSR